MKDYLDIQINIDGCKRSARLYKGRPLCDCPKGYRILGSYRHNIGNDFNSDLLTIYRVRGGLRYEIYRDGCFQPFYGKLEFLDEQH